MTKRTWISWYFNFLISTILAGLMGYSPQSFKQVHLRIIHRRSSVPSRPHQAGTGDSVVITGTYLTGATTVSFGGTAASSFTVNSDTQITAVVGSGSSGSISVTTSRGTATFPGFSYYGVLAISSFTPTSGVAGTSVVINGSYLAGSAVSFGGIAAEGVTLNSDSQITAIVGNGSSGVITVTTPGGTVASSTSFTFSSATAPTISSSHTGPEEKPGTRSRSTVPTFRELLP